MNKNLGRGEDQNFVSIPTIVDILLGKDIKWNTTGYFTLWISKDLGPAINVGTGSNDKPLFT